MAERASEKKYFQILYFILNLFIQNSEHDKDAMEMPEPTVLFYKQLQCRQGCWFQAWFQFWDKILNLVFEQNNHRII